MNTNESNNSLKNFGTFPGKIQNRHLDRSILLRETGSESTIKRILFLIGAIVVAFIVWANFLEIAEVASTTGKITHQGDAVMVQHLMGGRVKKVLVRNGTFVKEGQALILLDPIISKLERESIRGRKYLLSAVKIRLEALLSENEPDFSLIIDPNVAGAQRRLYRNELTTYALEGNVLINQIEQVESEIRLQKKQQVKLKKSVDLIKEELDIRKKLGSKGLNSRVAILQLEKEYNNAFYSLKQVPAAINKLSSRKQEIQNALAGMTAKHMENYARELSEVNNEITTLEKSINIFDSNIDALEVKAPVEGYVHDLRLQGPGRVAQPGDLLLTIIPTRKPLVAKVKIDSKDIGHIKTGQTATMRVATYDSRRYGVLKGKLIRISPSALIPGDQSAPYYEGIIQLEKPYLGETEGRMNVFSGMTLTADIRTGSKLFIDYLLKPIHIATQTSFHER